MRPIGNSGEGAIIQTPSQPQSQHTQANAFGLDWTHSVA